VDFIARDLGDAADWLIDRRHKNART
jgi:hypothetical protein